MRWTLAVAVVFATALFGYSDVVAQSETDLLEALAGDWAIYDDAFGVKGSTCQITLKQERLGEGYALAVKSCALEFGELTSWQILDGQLGLMVGTAQVAALGGNQTRMSGDSRIGAPVVMDRIGGNKLVDQLATALKGSGCYYLGSSTVCADPAQLAKPTFASDGTGANISVMVNLNARVEARDDAQILGVVPANRCVVVNACVTAADGAWCRAQFGERQGWLKKLALRQEKWPILTFVNQCTENAPTVPTPN